MQFVLHSKGIRKMIKYEKTQTYKKGNMQYLLKD